MLPRKKNDGFLSVPVSRVSSTQRLNQLNTVSRPNSPSYISSLLNPSRNVPITPTNHDAKNDIPNFENVPIVATLTEFENQLDAFTASISSFKGDQLADSMLQLVQLNDTLKQELESLKTHQELGKRIGQLKQQNLELDTKAKQMLRELISCRAELRKMPRLSLKGDDKESQNKEIDVKEALKYAMKLAKFTRAPPMVGNAQFQIHPNNFIWPAEDSLRRGMLALSSRKPEELIKQELGTAENSEAEQTMAEEHNEPEEDIIQSFDNNESKGNAAPLSLDLFDSEEDSD